MSLTPIRAVSVDALSDVSKGGDVAKSMTHTIVAETVRDIDLAAAGVESAEDVARQIDRAIAHLSTGDFHSRWTQSKRFTRQFAEWGDRSIPPLLKHLHAQRDPDTQWFLVRILSQFDHPAIVEALSQLLMTTTSEPLQVEISKVLSGFGESAIATLSELLAIPAAAATAEAAMANYSASDISDSEADISTAVANSTLARRRLAARTLAHIRRSGTIEPLMGLVSDPDPTLREIAIEALGSFHDPRITPLLLAALDDHPAICIEAIRTLGRRSDLLRSVDLVTPLQRCLRSPQESVACESAIALGRLGHESAITVLGTQLVQPLATPVKISIVQSLGWLNVSAAVAYLVNAFAQSTPVIMPVVKQSLAKALGQTRDPILKPMAASPLIEWLKHETAATAASDFALMQAIVTALTRLAEPGALSSLIPVLAHRDPRLRMHALSALKQIDASATQREIQRYLKDDDLSAEHKQRVSETLTAW